MNFWTWLATYYAIGLAFHLFVPKPPLAKAALETAERAHPAGFVLTAVLISTFWPICALGSLRRLLRRPK